MLRRKEIIESQEIIGITGSNGFIGKHLFDRLTSAKLKCLQLDRKGLIPKNINRVFDLASYGNIFTQTDVNEIYKANYSRVIDLLINSQGKKSIILTSSSSVLLPTQTNYSNSKLSMEGLVKEWVKATNENVVVVRPSTVIGVGENNEHLIPKLINSCFTGEEMNFVGEPTHDFIDVEDFVDAMILLSSQAEGYKGHIFNVSFGVSVNNEFIKDLVEDITKKNANIKRVKSLRPYDTSKWEVNNDKLRALGWRPRVLLWNTIKEMVEEYVKKNRS